MQQNLYNISAFNEKTIFLVCLFFTVFFRLQIYEAIAAFFLACFQLCFNNLNHKNSVDS